MKLNSFLRSAILAGIFAVPFIPIIVSPALFFPFITGKGFTYRILVEVIAALWLILALRDENYRPRWSVVLGALSAFVGILLLADVFGAAPGKSLWSNFERMEGFVAIFHHFLFFLVAGTVIATQRAWSLFFHASIGISFFMALYSTLQLGFSGLFSNIGLGFIAEHLNLPGEIAINQGGVRVDGTFGNAAYLAAYFLVHIFILAFYLSRERISRAGDILLSVALGSGVFSIYYLSYVSGPVEVGKTGAILVLSAIAIAIAAVSVYVTNRRSIWATRYLEPSLYIALIVFNVAILVASATRGAILGLIGGTILATLIIAIFERQHRFARKAAIATLAAVTVVAGLFFLARDSDFVRNSPSLVRIASINVSEGAPRFAIWNIGLKGFKERPLLGWGQENFNYLFNKYYDPSMYAQEQWFDRAHNIIVDWTVAAGALGILSYLSLYAGMLWLIWNKEAGKLSWLRKAMEKVHLAPQLGFSVTERAILTGLLAAYLFQNIFVFDNIGTYILFFSVMAYMHATYSVPLSEKMQKRLTFEPEFANRVLVPLVLVASVAALYFVNIKPLTAGTTLIDALRNQGQGDYPAALESYKKLFKMGTFADSEAREQVVQSAIYAVQNPGLDLSVKQGFVALAKTEIEKQLQEVPNDARYVLFLGYLYNRTQQPDAAIPVLEKAVSLSPSKQTIYFELGSAYLSGKRFEDAYKTFKTAHELAPAFKEAALFHAIGALYVGKKDEAAAILAESHGGSLVEDERIVKAYYDTQSWDLLLPIVQGRIAREPDNFTFRINLAAAFLGMGRRADAISQLNEAIRIDPNFKQKGEQWIADIRAGRDPS